MKLQALPKTTQAKNKRLGRGYGSGKGGHTTNRGQKGQKSRTNIPLWFVGTSWVWFKRLPMLKGKGKFKPLGKPVKTITLSALNVFKSGEKIDKQALIKYGILTESETKKNKIKVVATGKLKKKIKLNLPASQAAIKNVKKLGGEYLM